MNLALKQILFLNNLLYDAEIEYLKGTGTQYINTKIKTANDIDIRVSVDFTDTISQKVCWYFGAEESSTKNSLASYCIINGYSYIFNRNNYTQYQPEKTTSLIVQTGNSGIFVNGQKLANSSGSLTWFGDIFLFTTNRGGTPNLAETQTIKIKEMVILQGEVELMHLIPVRRGNIGYMYDKISKKLFGNVGSGNFILGPDI